MTLHIEKWDILRNQGERKQDWKDRKTEGKEGRRKGRKKKRNEEKFTIITNILRVDRSSHFLQSASERGLIFSMTKHVILRNICYIAAFARKLSRTLIIWK